MKIVIDMNLSPEWVAALRRNGFESVHWSSVGDPRAMDQQILAWAVANAHVVFTHDLDFGAILAAGGDRAPSVIQVRTRDTLPSRIEGLVVSALRRYQPDLLAGALVVVEEARQRVRILPIRRP